MNNKIPQMKKLQIVITLLIIISFSSVIKAQKDKNEIEPPKMPMDTITKQIMYRDVVQVEGEKDILFERALVWIKKQYKNTSEVIDSTNKEVGFILCSSRVKIFGTAKDGTRTMSGLVNYNLTLDIKDGKYRYTFTRFALKGTSFTPIEPWLDKTKKEWFPARYDNLREVDEQINEIIASLKEGMKPTVKKADEW